MLFSNFPAQSRRSNLRIMKSGIFITRTKVTMFPRVIIAKTSQVRISLTNIIIANFSIRIADFQHIYPWKMFFYELFFSNIPSTRDSREKAKLVTMTEVLRTCIAKIKFYEITSRKPIGQTSGKSLILAGNTIHYIFSNILCLYSFSLAIFQSCSKLMNISEYPVIM